MSDDNSLKLFITHYSFYSLPHISCLLAMLSIKLIVIASPVFPGDLPGRQGSFHGSGAERI